MSLQRLLLSIAFLGLAALILLAAANLSPAAAGGESEPVPAEVGWDRVDKLVDEQKLEEASRLTAELRARATAAGDVEGWTRGLIRETQLRTALHGYETAVRFLRSEPWPQEPGFRTAIGLYYAEGLITYYRAYSWEIEQRERIDTGGQIDLGAWTREQILEEAQQALVEVWARRQEWGSESIGSLAEYIRQNEYPARIRGTLRDAVTYLWVELLGDRALWLPEQDQEIYRLDLGSLLAEGTYPLETGELIDSAVHPLRKIAHLLGDLESWHRQADRPEAAFEARLERLASLHSAFDAEEDRLTVRRALEQSLDRLGRRLPWWSVGQAQLARFVEAEAAADSLIRARELALEGERAHPDTLGGSRCRHIAAAIEAPSFSMASMTSDGLDRRSIQVSHKNLERIHFRAYPFDLFESLGASEDRSLLPDWQEVERILAAGRPFLEWSVELPPTADYRPHSTYVTPPLGEAGAYLVVASARADFAEERNRRSAVNLILGDPVLLTRTFDRHLEVTVRSGASGRQLPGASVYLYRRDYRRGHWRAASASSDREGRARFAIDPSSPGAYFVAARHDGEVALDDSHLRAFREIEPRRGAAALIYTDRSVYRPGQEILWKVVAYEGRGGPPFEILPGASLEVELVDANGEEVATSQVTTNEFGSASGSFSIPAGKLLGAWSLRTSLEGPSSQVRVEEYKRPTFEVAILPPGEELRLNRPVRLTGEARYYFGLPVTSGQVRWRVSREPVWPRWGFWWPPPGPPRVIASGETALDGGGRFQAVFTAEADERERESGVSYRFRLSADVTGEGGETRTAEFTVSLGFVAVEARIETDRGFYRGGEPVEATIHRVDLDGAPRPGEGSWTLAALRQPPETLLPAEQPLPPLPAGEAEFATPGDRLRPRWDPGYSPLEVLRSWSDGEEVAAGRLEHGEDGRASLRLEDLPAGAYRLRYSTKDEEGAAFETRTELLVVEEGTAGPELPALLLAERETAAVGETARFLVHSGLAAQPLVVEIFRDRKRIDRRVLDSAAGSRVLEIPLGPEHRGGFSVALTALRDHQLMTLAQDLSVPWDDRRLQVELSSFRDRLRPGEEESWQVTVRSSDEETLAAGAAELLAYMYDRSLDLFAPHRPPDPLGLYPRRTGAVPASISLGASGEVWQREIDLAQVPAYHYLEGDRLKFLEGYGIGGMGGRRWLARAALPMRVGGPAPEGVDVQYMELAEAPSAAPPAEEKAVQGAPGYREAEEAQPAAELRSDFAETAFWEPHLVLEEGGAVGFRFVVPDSVTEWSVWAHALTRDLRSGSLETRARSVKELMVRPYLPRFLREGDRAELQVVVNNAGESEIAGRLDFEIFDPESQESLLADFGLSREQASGVPFTVEPGGGATLMFPISAPRRVGSVGVRVTARAGDSSDGEQRLLPLLPGRYHLAQSRFVALQDEARREMSFPDLAASDQDPSLIHEQLVVTLDAQLFYGVLEALPYLVSYPYECTEQTLNRFVSTGILSSLYGRYPAVAAMAEKLSARQTRFESWAADDPNRRMALEETPWLKTARGGDEPADDLIRVLDPQIAEAQRRASLAELEKAQTSLGGFPWWPGGPPSTHMTLYILNGLSRALEFGVEVPRPLVERAWGYLQRHYVDELARRMEKEDCCWELVTFLNYVLSAYPDESWTGGVFTADDRERMLDFSYRNWKRHSPLLKGYLTLTLLRAGRETEARLVFDSVMDSARTDPDLGTRWAPEERAWLWYNDTVESHAFALRVLSELDPEDRRRQGLVQWLFLNKQLSHWKSTRATAEVVYSLTHYLEREGSLGAREEATVVVGPRERRFVFEPGEYTGKEARWSIDGEEIRPAVDSVVTVEKATPGLLFASATWHFSTEELPREARGDLFQVERRLFKRVQEGDGWVLRPLEEGARLEAGDELEVQLSLRAKHAAEYVHLRDPRAAGFEPVALTSGYKWDLGLGRYEEIRDSGVNFFFDWLPAGEYTLKHRLRAATAGTFKAAPAQLQSMYAPEFVAYSAGDLVRIEGAR